MPKPLLQLQNSLNELKQTDLTLKGQAEKVKSILVSQLSNTSSWNEVELKLLGGAIKHFDTICSNVKGEMIYDHIPPYKELQTLQLADIQLILQQINEQLENNERNGFFIRHAVSCCWLAKHYTELLELSKKFSFNDQQDNNFDQELFAPAKRLSQLALFAGAWREQAEKNGEKNLQSVIDSLLRKFRRLGFHLNRMINPSAQTPTKLGEAISSLWRWFNQSSSQTQDSSLSESAVFQTGLNAELTASVIKNPEEQIMDELQQSMSNTTQELLPPPSAFNELEQSLRLLDSTELLQQISESAILRTEANAELTASAIKNSEEQIIDELQQSMVGNTHELLPPPSAFNELEQSLRLPDPTELLQQIKEVNIYLTQRAKETRSNCFMRLFGYDGQDYYDRRAGWTMLLTHLTRAAASGKEEDLTAAIDIINESINYFSASLFSRTKYANALSALLNTIKANPAALSHPQVAAYLNLSQRTYQQLDQYTLGKGQYQGVVGKEEFLSDQQAEETEEINQASGTLRTP